MLKLTVELMLLTCLALLIYFTLNFPPQPVTIQVIERSVYDPLPDFETPSVKFQDMFERDPSRSAFLPGN